MSNFDTDSPRDYARLINKTDLEGYAFWMPYPGGMIGDCGIVRPDGQFVKLFNVFAEDTGFERLPTAEHDPTRVLTADDLMEYPTPADRTERHVRIVGNTDICRAQEGRGWSVDLDVPIPMPTGQLSFGFSLSASKGMAAFLAPCGTRRRVEVYLRDRVFPEYLKRNSKAIRARYSDSYDMNTLYILEGTTHATSWCQGFTRQHGRELCGFVSVNPLSSLPQFRLGGHVGQTLGHSWVISAGPRYQPPDGALHLIRARIVVHHLKGPKWLSNYPPQHADKALSRPTSASDTVELKGKDDQGDGAKSVAKNGSRWWNSLF